MKKKRRKKEKEKKKKRKRKEEKKGVSFSVTGESITKRKYETSQRIKKAQDGRKTSKTDKPQQTGENK